MSENSDNNGNKIPEGVVNIKEYRKMLAYQKSSLIRNPIYIASTGEEINIGALPHRLRKKIEHLAPQEQDDIMELKRQYNVLRAKISSASAQAYGRAGCLGGRKRTDAVVIKLTPYQEDVIELLGRMFTTLEVVKILGQDYGVETSEEEVKTIYKNHITEIERKRDEFRNKVADVRLFNKRPRLEELAWMYSKMKTRYVALESVEAYNAMLRTLEQLRKEAEGDVLNINGILDINVEATIQNHIQKEILKTINLKEVILGRVAARMNMDLKKLIAGLHNSYYANFVDISGQYDPTTEMKYPSSSAYDFNMIERNAGNIIEDVKAIDVTEVQKASSDRTKELFLSKIRKQKEELKTRQANIEELAVNNRETAKDEDDLRPDKNIGKGRYRDIVPPSKTNWGKIRTGNKDYKTGTLNKKKK